MRLLLAICQKDRALMVAAEAPAQGAEMSYQTNSSGGPPSSIGIANGGT